MALKSILAAFSGDPASCSALKLALDLQRRHGAHLTGVVWHGPEPVAQRHRRYLTKGVSTMLSTREQALADAVRSDFETRVAQAGNPALSTFIDLHAVEDFSLPERARAYDLVVMSRHAAEINRAHAQARPDLVTLRSGRPVIVVPDEHSADIATRPMVVAWDGKRAAARALADALHLLAPDGPVGVLTIGSKPTPRPEAGDDVVDLLARHGLQAERILRPADQGGIARTILAACAERGAGLLVMGAYEHSRFTEDLLGGVTREILAGADLPVLMSH